MHLPRGFQSPFLEPTGSNMAGGEGREFFAVFLRETQSVKELATAFGVSDNDVVAKHVRDGQALAGQVTWVKPKLGTSIRLSALADSRYVVNQCKSDVIFQAPLLQPMVPLPTSGFLDTAWSPRPPKYLPLKTGQVDMKKRCAYLPNFGEFEWDDADYAKVGVDPDAIVLRGSWEKDNIKYVPIPQLKGVKGGMGGSMMFNKRSAGQLQGLWNAWDRCGFVPKVLNAWGYVARYQRSTNPKHSALSNHAFGTAFDINTEQNMLGRVPARLGEAGCVREMVEVANEFGFYWGGHFSVRTDGMHFEVAVPM